MGVHENQKEILDGPPHSCIAAIGSLDRILPRISYCTIYIHTLLGKDGLDERSKQA